MSTEDAIGMTSLPPCSDISSAGETLCNPVRNATIDNDSHAEVSRAIPFLWTGDSDNNNNDNVIDNTSDSDTFVFSEGFADINVSSYFILDGTLDYENSTVDTNGSLPSIAVSSSSSSSNPLLSNEFKISLITLYTITTLFAILGNIIVVIVFAHGRRCRTDIRPFLINLALADLILAIFCMPFTFTYVMTRNWIFSSLMCPIVLFMQHLSVSASVFTNMAIGIDRFLVVTYPLKARLATRRAKYTIAIIWLCSISLSSVQWVVARAKEFPEVNMVHCDERWNSKHQRTTFTISVLLITYIIPLVILSVTYSIVSVIMWKRTAPGNAHEGRDVRQLKGKRKVIKMLVLIVIMFALCWLPLHTFFLVMDFTPELQQNESESVKRTLTIIFYVAHWLAMSNSCANPIIYGFMNDSFRVDLAALGYTVFPFCRCLKKVANRRFSMTTNADSAYNRRFSTLRRSPINSLQQSPRRYGSKIYIELRRDNSKDGSVKDFTPSDFPDRYARNSAAPFAPRRNRRPHSSYLREGSDESSQGLTSTSMNYAQNQEVNRNHFFDTNGRCNDINSAVIRTKSNGKTSCDESRNITDKPVYSNGVSSNGSNSSSRANYASNNCISSRPCIKLDSDSNGISSTESPHFVSQ